MKTLLLTTLLGIGILLPQGALANEISIDQNQQQAVSVETESSTIDVETADESESVTLEAEGAENDVDETLKQTDGDSVPENSKEQNYSMSQGGSPSDPLSTDKLEAVFNFLVKVLSDNPLVSAGLNTDEAKGVVVVDTDGVGRTYLAAQLAASDYVDSVVFGADVTFGSGNQEVWSGGGSFQTYCTGAFPAQIGSQLGMLTAAHCYSDPNTSPIAYEGNIIQSIVKAPSTAGDIAFIGLLGQTSGLTRTSASTFEPMSWFRNPVVGEGVCHFGITTGKSCSTVRAKYQYAQLEGEPLSNIGVAQSDISWYGDSGGPWFTNTNTKIAVGVHLGAYLVDGFTRSIFTMISIIGAIQATLVLNGLQ